MKIIGLGGLVLGVFIFIILSVFLFCSIIINSRFDDDDDKKR